jgi:hypothetical protein
MTQKKESANMNTAKEAGAKIHKAIHKIAKLIEEAFALWGAFAEGIDPFGSGDRLCTEEVWNYVNWYKVKWAY